jgi:branched-chain amino acid transport system substrate-binding protein
MAQGKKRGFSRRSFMKIMAAVTGSAVLPSPLPALAWRESCSSSAPPLKVGILLPSSNLNPRAPQNLLAGFGLGLETAQAATPGSRIVVITEDIGTGQMAAPVKAGMLLESDQVDLLIGFVNPAVGAMLAPLFRDNSRVPFLAANMGEYMNRSGDCDPAILRSTLLYWQSHWTMGVWAAEHIGKTAYIASSLYDSGYDSSWAFQLGFESSGGEIVGRSPAFASPAGAELFAEIGKIEPALVYGLYSGNEAVDFVRGYAATGLAGTIPLAGSAFLADEDNLRRLGEDATGILSCFSWSPDLTTPENLRFIGSYEARHGRTPDAFGLLGYDTATIAVEALRLMKEQQVAPESLTTALASARLVGPRGPMAIEAGSCNVTSSLYIREVVMRGRQAVNQRIATAVAISERDRLTEPVRSAMRTGWNNAYLCA